MSIVHLRPSPSELMGALLRQDFELFLAKAFRTLRPALAFEPNWHHAAIAYALERIRRGEIHRLIINMPPRSLKSLIASVAFPAYVLGRDPSERLVCVSYSAALAAALSNDFRAIIESPWYQGAFPNARIGRWKDAQAEIAFTQHGFRLATSTGGSLTGRGGSYIILDDPLKPIDALSAPRREACNAWFANTLLSRLDDKRTGRIIIVAQRLHLDDLVGYVTRDGEGWHILSLPAIAEVDMVVPIGPTKVYRRFTGDVLHAAREPLTILDKLKSDLGSDIFSAQYQQTPVPAGGAMIKRSWIVHAAAPARRLSDQIIQSWDTASKAGPDNDYSVCTTWLRTTEGHSYLLNVLRARMDYPTLKARSIAHAREWDATAILVEDAGTGMALIPELKAQGIPAVAIRPERDKIARMSVHSAKFEAGLVVFPHHAPWLADLEAELFAFPAARHDDQVDSISQALAWRQRRIGAAIV